MTTQRAALMAAKEKFLHYAEVHAAKGGHEKAAVNTEMAAMMDAALAEPDADPSCDDRHLAEMIMSDCGHSTNHTLLLDRITDRIAKHVAVLAEPEPEPEHKVSTPPMLLKSSPEQIWLGLFTDDEDTKFPSDHDGVCWASDDFADLNVAYIRADLANPGPQRREAMMAENKRLREALLRLRHWSMGGNYHGGVVADLQQWIDGGMTGELPEYPAHLPPIQHTEGIKP